MEILVKESKRFLREYRIESILIIITVFILTTSTAYGDFYATTRHGIEFWNALFEGQPLRFYEYCQNSRWGNDLYYGNAGCAYDFSVYAVFALWNFPIWLIEMIFKINAQGNLFCVIWSKLLMVCAVFVSARTLCKIYKLLTENRGGGKQKDFLILNYVSSLFLFSYTISSGNYDILAIVVMLCGIKNYLAGDYKKFLVWFMIAATFKYFAAFIFIPLVLLSEKRIFFIIRDMVILISLSIVEKIIFTRHAVSNISETAGGIFLGWIQEVTVAQKIEIEGIGTVSLLFILYAALAIYCYMQEDHNNTLIFKKKAVYVCLCAWSIYFILSLIHSYWSVLIVPFLTLVLQNGNKNKKVSYMMEILFSVTMFLRLNMRQHWILGGATCLRMLPHRIQCLFFPGIIQKSDYYLGNILTAINDRFNIQIYLSSACLVTLAVFLIINFPKEKEEKNNVSEKEEMLFIRSRLLINIGFAMMPAAVWILQYFIGF